MTQETNLTPPPPSEHTYDGVAQTAIWAAQHGFSVIPPPREDGSNAPQSSWSGYIDNAASPETVEGWYKDRKTGFGLITGPASGNLVLLEFDDVATWDAFCLRAEEQGLGDLLGTVTSGYQERSPRGVHLVYRAFAVGGNTKLAERRDESGGLKVLIETRGKGGYFIAAPSYGGVHPAGEPYKLICGGLDRRVTLNAEEHDALFALARSFNEVHKEPGPKRGSAVQTGRLGDDFNERGPSWGKILEPHGWIDQGDSSGTRAWQRPGKKHAGTSATTGYGDCDLLYVFTTASEFEANCAYSKFAAYTVLNREGDYPAAAKALRKQGYGRDSTILGQGLALPITDVGAADRLNMFSCRGSSKSACRIIPPVGTPVQLSTVKEHR